MTCDVAQNSDLQTQAAVAGQLSTAFKKKEKEKNSPAGQQMDF